MFTEKYEKSGLFDCIGIFGVIVDEGVVDKDLEYGCGDWVYGDIVELCASFWLLLIPLKPIQHFHNVNFIKISGSHTRRIARAVQKIIKMLIKFQK